MKQNAECGKSCGPKLFHTGKPDATWSLHALGRYAQAQARAIADQEQTLTVRYWHLGLALNLARRNFGRGQWGCYLQELGIEKTRASKARAIHRTCPDVNDAAGLTVEEAYAKRRRRIPPKLTSPSGQSTDDRESGEPAGDLTGFVHNIYQNIPAAIEEAKCAGPSEAAALLPAVRRTISLLEEVRASLERAAGE